VKTLAAAIDETIGRMRAGGVLDAAGCAGSVIEDLALEDPAWWAVIRDQLVLATITATIQRRLQRLLEKSDERQGWLPGVPQFIKIADGVVDKDDATLSQYREAEAELEARIKSYNYPRRSPEKLKRDKHKLAAMRKEDRRVTPFMAGDPEMKMGPAIELYRASLETPKATRNRLLASKGGYAKSRRTKNQ
jgi:hypothetical protein